MKERIYRLFSALLMLALFALCLPDTAQAETNVPLEDGVPVEFAVTFFPYSRIWHKGETLRLQIAGKYIRDEGWFERLVWDSQNAGTQTIHSGPAHPAYLQIPFIPPKYKSGDYELR